jgi:signal peptidase I
MSGMRHPGWLQPVQSLLGVIVIALFILTFTAQPFRIPSESMEPTLLVGDFLLVNKQVEAKGPSAKPQGWLAHMLEPASGIGRGDLVVFHYPVDPAKHLVKRVLGLPGDRLRLHEGRVYINGQALSEPYAIFRPSGPDSYRDDFPRMQTTDPEVEARWWIAMHSLVQHGELTVPPDSYFVLGDNRNESADSRYWGLVPRAAIVGKPFLIYFSMNGRDGTISQATHPVDGMVADRREGAAPGLTSFARWDRALRVIY